ncbi:MFS transporter [Chamaesiphon sp. GL140_3_metabinner_50]|uniref:AmpG family muropeptide MFS transporter n=1 Tax=Chamaesiphon sp. GL140_3_metabinner_50 TaxID=2970812 RepID=UPI0025ECE3A0|nr:MFS transporter [Chamaesiphon sp. GL140_3_metabinner_50]
MKSLLQVFQSRKMAALLVLGFASGLPSQIIDAPLKAWLSTANVGVPAITQLSALAMLPYAWKFVWSPLLDKYVPPFLGRRRGWLLVTQIALIFTIGLMAIQQPSANNLQVITILAVTIGFFSASQDIASDAYRTDVLEELEMGAGAALFTFGFRIAMLLASGWALIAADPTRSGHLSWQAVYLILAGLMSLGLIATLLAPQPIAQESTPPSLLAAIVLPFQDFFQRRGIVNGILVLLLIVIYKIGDYMVKGVATPFLLEIHFTQTQIGTIQGGLGIVATILGAFVGAIVLNKIGINRALWVSIGLLSIGIIPYWLLAQSVQLAPVGQSPSEALLILAINSEYFFAGMEATAFIAFLMSLCNRQFSATQYALFTSLMLSGKSFIVAPMGSIAKQIGWSNFFLLSILAAVPGLILLTFLAPWNSKAEKNSLQ